MTKLETLKNFMKDLVQNIAWFEENAHELDVEVADKDIADLYLFELNQLEEISQEIAQVTEWEQLGYHENKIVELFDAMYPVVEIIETITQTLGNNGAKKEITLFSDARILIEKYNNEGKLMWQLFKDATTSNLEWLSKQGFTNKIYDVRKVVIHKIKQWVIVIIGVWKLTNLVNV